MIAHKALQVAHLIKAFGACMTAPNTMTHIERALEFNALFDDHLKSYPEESAASIARHISRAIKNSEELDQELYERVLPDVIYVLGLSIKQDGLPERKKAQG